jgi:hypothetical protein
MNAAAAARPVHVGATCRVCRDQTPQPACFVLVEGAEQPACRLCWEQAVLDPRRVARRLRSPGASFRFRTL